MLRRHAMKMNKYLSFEIKMFQVLDGLIGFTVSEFSEKKKMRKTNPAVGDYLRDVSILRIEKITICVMNL